MTAVIADVWGPYVIGRKKKKKRENKNNRRGVGAAPLPLSRVRGGGGGARVPQARRGGVAGSRGWSSAESCSQRSSMRERVLDVPAHGDVGVAAPEPELENPVQRRRSAGQLARHTSSTRRDPKFQINQRRVC